MLPAEQGAEQRTAVHIVCGVTDVLRVPDLRKRISGGREARAPPCYFLGRGSVGREKKGVRVASSCVRLFRVCAIASKRLPCRLQLLLSCGVSPCLLYVSLVGVSTRGSTSMLFPRRGEPSPIWLGFALYRSAALVWAVEERDLRHRIIYNMRCSL